MKWAMRVQGPNDSNAPAPPGGTPEAEGWSNVTPGDASLLLEFGASGQPVVHPSDPSKVYIGYDQQGIWESTDYGKEGTFVRVSPLDSIVAEGAIWFLAISPDGSTMVAGHGHDTTNERHLKLIVSNDLGRTWYEGSGVLDFQPYDCKFDPDNSSRALFTSHSPGDGNVYLSENMHLTNGAITATSIGDTGLSNSGYAIFGLDGNTVLFFRDDDDDGAGDTLRKTWNGSAWSSWSAVGNIGHFHGSFDPYVDRVLGRIYVASASGISISDDDGATWSSLLGSVNLASVHKRGDVIMAGLSYALGPGGEFGPNIRRSVNAGASFTTDTDPTGMDNGPRAWCSTVNPAGQYVFTCNCWCSGTHRLVVTP
jgi:hypothetical protein